MRHDGDGPATQRGLDVDPAFDELEHPARGDRQLDHMLTDERAGTLVTVAQAIRHEAPRVHFLAVTLAAGSLAPASKNSCPGMPGPHRLANR